MSTDLDPRDADLRSRFTTAASTLDVDAGEVAEVRSRGRRRARNQRVVMASGVIGAVALAVVGVSSLTPTAAPTIDPVGGSETVAPETDTDVDRAPSPTANEGSAHPLADLRDQEFAFTRFDEDELVRNVNGTHEPYDIEHPITRAIATTDGRVVFQTSPRGQTELGGGLSILTDGDLHAAGPLGRAQRLLAVTEERAWFTYRLGGEGEEDREELAWFPLDGPADREATTVGTSNPVESFTDDVVFLTGDDLGGPIAYLDCHLQCSLYTAGSVRAMIDGEVDRDLLSGWLYGLDTTPDGGLLATVVGPDPNLQDDTATLTLVEVTGEVHTEIPLPSGIDWGSGRVEFSPDNEWIAVTDLDGGWLVSDWQTDAPTIERLAEGLSWHSSRDLLPPRPDSDDPRRYTDS